MKKKVSMKQMATIGVSAAKLKRPLRKFVVRTPSNEMEHLFADTVEVTSDCILRFTTDGKMTALYASWIGFRDVTLG
jgi:hypothetical protein